jgi:hypothetical protein
MKNHDGAALMAKMKTVLETKRKHKKGYTRSTTRWSKDDLLLLHLHVARVTKKQIKEMGGIAKYIGSCAPLRIKFPSNTIYNKWSNLRCKGESKMAIKLNDYLHKINSGLTDVTNPYSKNLEKYADLKTPLLLKETITVSKPEKKPPVNKPTAVVVNSPIKNIVSQKANRNSTILNFLSVLFSNDSVFAEIEIEGLSETSDGITIGKISFRK